MIYRLSSWLLACCLVTTGVGASDTDASAESGNYAGSAACQGCHTYIYNNWRSTRHSFSVRTSDEARQAGYPLPHQRRAGAAHDELDWDDLSYVIGGRQRIAYVDTSGRVLDTSFHHRIGDWDVFPTLEMSICRDCHFTGVDRAAAQALYPARAGGHAERNIGCEACHGPGATHVKTLEKTDIDKNPSSKVCGQCHTSVGKILPKGELHATHDLVQNWNRDRHVTGVRRQSHNAFCSTCHSPYDGSRPGQDAGRLVFTEEKLNITCIGCHDPHQLSNPRHLRESATLASPSPIRAHTFIGNDSDFTTTDHREWDSAAESCLGCHRGADRVDLDHANATCVDCHNTFKRNHGPESKQFHDANRPGLSCRGCHDNAEFLMSILYQDPDFLEPRHVHNLRRLPARVRERYAFRYPALRRTGTILVPGNTVSAADPEPSGRSVDAPASGQRGNALMDLLEREQHSALTRHASIRELRVALLDNPGSPLASLLLAEKYADLGESILARELLGVAYKLDSSRVLLEMPLLNATSNRDSSNAVPDDSATDEIGLRIDRVLPRSVAPDDSDIRHWLHAYLHMRQGRFDAGLAAMPAGSPDATTTLYRALGKLGQGRLRDATALLETSIERYPEHHASRAALGLAHFARKRSAEAEKFLQHAISIKPEEGGARLILGHVRIASGDLSGAEKILQSAIEVEPELLEARFFLAQVYQLAGNSEGAVQVFDEIIDLEPNLFDARYALANLLKLWSDQINFRLRAKQEKNPHEDLYASRWPIQLELWREQIDKLRNRALAELAVARSLRPQAFDVVRQVAEIYRGSNRLDEARKFYQWLLEREPDVWLHRYRLGTVWYALGRYAEAVDELRRATAMAPTDGDARLALGLALVRAGRLDQAIVAFEKATTYEPFNPALYTNLGAAYANQGDLTRAQAAFERSLELHSFPLPRVHLTHTNLALVHLRSGRIDEAVIALRRALHSYADYPLARELLVRATRRPQDNSAWPGFVYNEWLERFGEVTSVAFSDE